MDSYRSRRARAGRHSGAGRTCLTVLKSHTTNGAALFERNASRSATICRPPAPPSPRVRYVINHRPTAVPREKHGKTVMLHAVHGREARGCVGRDCLPCACAARVESTAAFASSAMHGRIVRLHPSRCALASWLRTACLCGRGRFELLGSGGTCALLFPFASSTITYSTRTERS
jgi:hypothetical protein